MAAAKKDSANSKPMTTSKPAAGAPAAGGGNDAAADAAKAEKDAAAAAEAEANAAAAAKGGKGKYFALWNVRANKQTFAAGDEVTGLNDKQRTELLAVGAIEKK